jgi:hypothetical protein
LLNAVYGDGKALWYGKPRAQALMRRRLKCTSVFTNGSAVAAEPNSASSTWDCELLAMLPVSPARDDSSEVNVDWLATPAPLAPSKASRVALDAASCEIGVEPVDGAPAAFPNSTPTYCNCIASSLSSIKIRRRCLLQCRLDVGRRQNGGELGQRRTDSLKHVGKTGAGPAYGTHGGTSLERISVESQRNRRAGAICALTRS